jgi:hypothetical protein
VTVQYVDVAPRTSAIAYRPQVFLVRSRVPIAFLVPDPERLLVNREDHARRVKRHSSGEMALRWAASEPGPLGSAASA